MAKFLLQELRHEVRDIWVPPSPIRKLPSQSDSVAELRKALADLADRETWAWWRHYRIVTSDGNPVERWKIKPGRAVKTRRKS